MEKLITPFGKIKILIDGIPVDYCAREGLRGRLCPHVLGRYQIEITYVPDGKEHDIACVFEPVCEYNRSSESGERLECQGFYNKDGFKMSIGVECDIFTEEYDYTADYLENGMAYHIKNDTGTKKYVFGISWIDNVGWEHTTEEDDDRDAETWYGADPTIALELG